MAANVFIKYIFAIRKLKFFNFHRHVALRQAQDRAAPLED